MGQRIRAGQAAFLMLFLSVSQSHAADPFKDFTFRMLKPPAQDAKRRITIQIGPAKPEPDKSQTIAVSNPVGENDWFWTDISADITAAAPGRFGQAQRQLAKSPPGALDDGPRLQTYNTLAAQYGTDILLATLGTRISPALVLAVIAQTARPGWSGPDNRLATGLLSLSPQVAKRFGVVDPLDPGQNLKAGVAYLDWLLDLYHGDPILALAGFSAGEDAITEFGGVPPFAPTRSFVPRVVAGFQVTRALCKTPPELYSDGCVFDTKDTQ